MSAPTDRRPTAAQTEPGTESLLPSRFTELRALLRTALEVASEIERIGAGEGSRPSSPVAPDGPEKLRNEDDAALRNYLSKPKGIDERD